MKNRKNKIQLTDLETKSIAPNPKRNSNQRAISITVECPTGYDVSCKADSASGVIVMDYGVNCQGTIVCCKGYAGSSCEAVDSGSGSGSGSTPTNEFEACKGKNVMEKCSWIYNGLERFGHCAFTPDGEKLFCSNSRKKL
ncbi:MAG: hypothetical protein K2H33_03185 [Muribaculaceae bacterium]|nr:hypothetical protein [Muribaculaceae bacterium]